MIENKLEVFYEEKPCYPIYLEPDDGKLVTAVSELDVSTRKICVVTDSNVGALHADRVVEKLKTVASKVVCFTFPAGEMSKNLDTVQELYEFLIQEGFDRNDVLAALGGGVVGDLTGFAAATYLRGIRFFQLPTSLLAMVDSSIGGKTGVDFKAYKNMVGAFYMPQFVYMDMGTLSTLPEREYISGFGEIIKHGLIRDKAYYEWLKEKRDALLHREISEVTEMVYRSLLVKKAVVERDPKEKGERALLNFGHTIGHAVEKQMEFRLLHGECVAVGIAAAAYISESRSLITTTELKDILEMLQSFHLPIAVDELDIPMVLHTVAKDKKMDAGKIKFILIREIGEAVIDSSVTREEMKDACDFVTK